MPKEMNKKTTGKSTAKASAAVQGKAVKPTMPAEKTDPPVPGKSAGKSGLDWKM